MRETDGLQRRGHPLAALLGRDAVEHQGKRHVLLGRQPRNQVERLEDEADPVAAYVRELLVV